MAPNTATASLPMLPDYVPVRMLNEYVYCRRLFYYEWVEGVFIHSADTVEGALRHEAIDDGTNGLPQELDGAPFKTRAIQMSSDEYGIIAKMDVVESDGAALTPVEYKKGRPCSGDDGPMAWPADRAQVVAQAMILRSNRYTCDEAVLYYSATKDRVVVPIDERIIIGTRALVEDARATAQMPLPPPPLVDSPKCAGCSLVGFCLPDETQAAHDLRDANGRQMSLFASRLELTETCPLSPDGIRRLVPARDDLRPLYIAGHDFSVGKSGNTLRIRSRSGEKQDVRVHDVSQVNLFGNVQLTASALKMLCDAERPIAHFSHGGWFYGFTQGLGLKNVFLRRDQFRAVDVEPFCLLIARSIVRNKIRNQRKLLQRNHTDAPRLVLRRMQRIGEGARSVDTREQLLGLEGAAAAMYFGAFSGMLKVDDGGDECAFKFKFEQRNRRPPRDPINAMLSFCYALLAKDATIVVASIGFDPFMGFYHQPRFGRPALALDLMEAFRPLVADSAVLTAINTRMVRPGDFVRVGDAVSMKPKARTALLHAYEQRMDALVTHPLFGYRVSYRRVLEIQARLLARVVTGELGTYVGFETR